MKTFQKILSEAVSQKLKNELKGMGPLRAKEVGITTDDFVNIVYDGDIVQYVAKNTPFLLNLTIYGRSLNEKKYIFKYHGDSSSVLNGTVLEYFPSNPPIKPQSEGWVHHNKWTFLKDYMTKWQFMDFMNEYYDLNMQELRLEPLPSLESNLQTIYGTGD